MPTFDSVCQTFKRIKKASPNDWDCAYFELKKPLVYNECGIFHVHSKNDDSDGKAQPILYLKIEYPISFIHFSAYLSYKPNNYNKVAYFERKLFGTNIESRWETIESVPFNSKNKCYVCMLQNPVPGYVYQLRWEK